MSTKAVPPWLARINAKVKQQQLGTKCPICADSHGCLCGDNGERLMAEAGYK